MAPNAKTAARQTRREKVAKVKMKIAKNTARVKRQKLRAEEAGLPPVSYVLLFEFALVTSANEGRRAHDYAYRPLSTSLQSRGSSKQNTNSTIGRQRR